MDLNWDRLLADRASAMKSSVIRELLKLTEQPDVISFGGGLPSPEVFPIEKFSEACDIVLKETGAQALQYGTTEGYRPLREFLAMELAKSGANIREQNVLITSGSQQGLDLIGRVLINPGDTILVESPTYLGALQAWAVFGAQYDAVPCDENGMIVEQLEEKLKRRPKLVYVLPTFQNPMGITLSLERRKVLVELANKYQIPIVEDDPYGKLRYEGTPIPSVLTLDAERRGETLAEYRGNVIYLGTFSKTLAPGLRLAWMVAHPDILTKFVQAKQGADLHTATFTQMVAYQVAHDGYLDKHLNTIKRVYREHRDVMLESMAHSFPRSVQWTKPQGGLFLWVTLPEGCSSTDMLSVAVKKQKVAFVPGSPFFPLGGGENSMRMNFSNASPDAIREGIRRLGLIFQEQFQ